MIDALIIFAGFGFIVCLWVMAGFVMAKIADAAFGKSTSEPPKSVVKTPEQRAADFELFRTLFIEKYGKEPSLTDAMKSPLSGNDVAIDRV